MATYTVRRATAADIDVLVAHRLCMFEDMGVLSTPGANAARMSEEFRAWLVPAMSDGTYLAWLIETPANGVAAVVAGAGATIIPWPPGPFYSSGRLAFVYNVYTDPTHRRRGLARMLMDAIHEYCRASGIGSVALNASAFGRPLYESMGYRVTGSPMMFLSLE